MTCIHAFITKGRRSPIGLNLLTATCGIGLLLSGCDVGNTQLIEPPSAVDDHYAMFSTDESLNVTAANGVLANDNDGKTTGLTAELVTPPQHQQGEFQLQPDGAFRYLPDDSGASHDSFTYRAKNADGESTITQVTITITPNQRPTGQADAYLIGLPLEPLETTAENGLLANDNDADGDPLSARLVDPPKHNVGTFTLAEDGSFRYEFDGGSETTDQFTYVVSDGKSISAPITVTLTVNTPPVVSNDCHFEPQPADISGTLNASDNEAQTVTFREVPLDPPATEPHGTLDIDAKTGAFTYHPPATKEQGYQDIFQYQADDGAGGIATGTLTFIVGTRRIMPLGDSITWGVDSVTPDSETGDLIIGPEAEYAIGYRKKLYQLLSDAGYAFDFVGGEHNGSAAGLPDTDHQGISGITSQEVANNIGYWLNDTPPDVILLHIGTNDHDTDVSAVNDILTTIDQWSKDHHTNIQVLLARIIDARPFGQNAIIQGFNHNLENLVATHWPKVLPVDQFSALTYPDDMSQNDVTGLHPAQSGYDKMAQRWFETLQKHHVIHRCPPAPSSAPPTNNP